MVNYEAMTIMKEATENEYVVSTQGRSYCVFMILNVGNFHQESICWPGAGGSCL
jgi:hypothetical protein